MHRPAGNNAGFHGGGAQRAVDLSSLERHAHTSCVLIIPGYALKKKKKLFGPGGGMGASSRSMNLPRGGINWGGGGGGSKFYRIFLYSLLMIK